ncbi:DUF7544 domain-containing protein [Thermocatellispora tengchongensis]|uniref:DUF7544 domain-containing protein n=1 Tax=Thermocatellispora tengchongensis TaxID=1073253 RepID=UPI003629818E
MGTCQTVTGRPRNSRPVGRPSSLPLHRGLGFTLGRPRIVPRRRVRRVPRAPARPWAAGRRAAAWAGAAARLPALPAGRIRPAPGYGGQGAYGFRPPPPALRPGIIPLRPLGLGDILDGTIKLVRSNPKSVLGLSAIVAAIGSIPVAIGNALLYGELGENLDDPGALENATTSGVATQYGSTLISLAVQFVAVTLLTGVLTRILGRAVFGGRLTAGEAWRLVRPRTGALFGLVALTGLIMLAPMVLLALLLVAVYAGNADPVAALGLTLVFLLLYIPYVLFFTTRFALAAPALVLEGRGVTDSMRRSWNLVTGDFWRVLGILLLTSLLAGLIGSVFTIPFTFVGAFVGLLGGGSTGSIILTAVLITVGATLGSMITYPVQAGVYGLMYADRRMRAEAFDLVLQTAAIEQQRQGWVHASADDLWLPENATPPQPPRADTP